MGTYKITITANGSGPETVISVDTAGATPRVVELAVRATRGLAAPTLPSYDLDLLLRALLPADTDAAVAAQTSRAGGGELAMAKARGTRAGMAKRSARAAGVERRRDGQARVYRRMPDDVVEVFDRAGSVTGVAQHYGVPRHTAQGWIGRLRSRGAIPNPA